MSRFSLRFQALGGGDERERALSVGNGRKGRQSLVSCSFAFEHDRHDGAFIL
jgi:hypothetical protein